MQEQLYAKPPLLLFLSSATTVHCALNQCYSQQLLDFLHYLSRISRENSYLKCIRVALEAKRIEAFLKNPSLVKSNFKAG